MTENRYTTKEKIMNLPIVPHDISNDLKELGFDWRTINFYSGNKELSNGYKIGLAAYFNPKGNVADYIAAPNQ